MASKTQHQGLEVVTISSPDGHTRASFVPEKGGTGSSIIMPHAGKDRELLYLHDHFWEKNNPRLPGGSPFLFPICARLERMGVEGNYLYDGKVYNMPIHGFGPTAAWEVTKHDTDQLTLVLRDSEKTRAMYPFHFEVSLTYRVANKELLCEQRYSNTGNRALPYYAGFHPYFLTPPFKQGKADIQLNYHPLRHFKYNERLTDLVGEQALFSLPTSILNPDINEHITQVGADKTVSLTYPDGFTVRISADGVHEDNLFPYVHLYNIPEKPFFCIEPWMGFPNAMNTVLGARWLQPGESDFGVMRLWSDNVGNNA